MAPSTCWNILQNSPESSLQDTGPAQQSGFWGFYWVDPAQPRPSQSPEGTSKLSHHCAAEDIGKVQLEAALDVRH